MTSAVDGAPASARGDTESDSLRVAGWTLVSRLTGLARVIVIGATLGPTFFANIFQATNLVPNAVFTIVAGWLLTTLLVPSLVEAMQREGIERAQDIARGFLGVIIAGFSVVALALLGAGPVIVRALTMGIDDATAAASARHQAWVLLLLVVPQVVLYATVSVAIAAQNARSRFALPAAAPAVENVGLIVTLLLAAHWYGAGRDVGSVTSTQLLVLGIGATLSVLAHAAIQLLGATAAGIALRPSWGWRDPDVRRTLAGTVPLMLTGLLDGISFLALTIAAGIVPGGVVAFQMAYNFYNVPIALGARAVGTALLPRLSRFAARRELEAFGQVYEGGLGLTWFLAVPAGAAIAVLAHPLAEVLALGELSSDRGVELLSVFLVSLGVALIGASTFEMARQAAYARFDTAAPLRAGLVRVGITLTAVFLAMGAFDDTDALLGLGVAVAAGDYIGAAYLHRAVRRGVPFAGLGARARVAKSALASLVMLVPAALVARLVPEWLDGRFGRVAGLVAACLLGLAIYGGVHVALRSPELARFGVLPGRLKAATGPTGEVP